MVLLKMKFLLGTSIFHFLFLLEGCLAVSPVLIHPDRDALLRDALNWMTLRRDGKLLAESQLAPMLESLREKYRASPFFRSFVMAFQYGVLRRLRLFEGEDCDPAYPKMYKDPFNNSVTWHSLKSFIFENYHTTETLSRTGEPLWYCDFRQGLVCNLSIRKCTCPEGSSMVQVEMKVGIRRRCLLEENEICSLEDLSQHPTHHELLKQLPRLLFNPERPLGCQDGCQCRYRFSDIPRCYRNYLDDWTSPRVLSYGDECALDLFSDHGGGLCGFAQYRNTSVRLVCYNYWGTLSGRAIPVDAERETSKRLGFCATEYGQFESNRVRVARTAQSKIDPYLGEPFIKLFINPRTTPLRGFEAREFDARVYEVNRKYFYHRIVETNNKPCSINSTARVKDLYTFFARLEDPPPFEEDYVADKPTLYKKLAELESVLGRGRQRNICRVMWKIKKERSWDKNRPPYTCVRTRASPDAFGNDGTCQITSDNDGAFPNAQYVAEFFQRSTESKRTEKMEENGGAVTRRILQKHSDSQCTPAKNSEELFRPFGNDDVRNRKPEECFGDTVCYEDLQDSHTFVGDLCAFNKSPYKPRYYCRDASSTSLSSGLGKCELSVIQARIDAAFRKITKLENGAPCQHETESYIRNQLAYDGTVNYGYLLVASLEVLLANNDGLCEASKLLECSSNNTCGCIKEAARRTLDIGQKTYKSEFCYLKEGETPQHLNF